MNKDILKKQSNDRSERFSRTREQHATEMAEDYVEAVQELIESNGECRVLELARHFNVSHVTVSRTVGRLQKDGLLETAPYKPITLTQKGRKLAERVKKRHEVVLEFLLVLGVDKKAAQIDSEGIEHHVSEKTLAAMKKFLKQRASLD
jgi:DtxR family manganese transport transcriptional regulator